MGIISEFKEFALKGNMVDMAVGIIIGGAFGTIVNSLIKDVIMPPIGMMMGGVDFSAIKITLAEAAEGKEAVAINIGNFINNLISFLVLAFAVFIMVRSINNLRRRFEKEQVAEDPAPTATETLLTEIRDELRKQ